MQNIFTPVNAQQLAYLLQVSGYDKKISEELVSGFTNGFDLGYRGPENVQQTSRNLKFTIGDEIELWNKVMKEVKENRYAGPFEDIPFDNYIQSPIGLVPKDNGTKTRLIFHLSHARNRELGVSVNGFTPEDLTKVKYKTFEEAVQMCIKEGIGCYVGKSDMTSAFRHFGILKKHWKYLVMKAKNPMNKKWYYFVDKCMPFGASISCAHFQKFSDAIAHIVRHNTKKDNVNYLDDFFFCALLKAFCDGQINTFLKICASINFPVSMEKTFFGTTKLTFLGLLIDTHNQLVCVPVDKVKKALDMINRVLTHNKRKTTLHNLQQITGFLNFLGKAVSPGRAFTRRLYHIEERSVNKGMKPYHHVDITAEMRSDLELWKEFLQYPTIYSTKFINMDKNRPSIEMDFYTDASANPLLGCGGISGEDWYIMQWNENFIRIMKPSINYLELYGVTIAILAWIHKYKNQQITIFCDNMSVVHMFNKSSSSCKNCMVLIRMIVLQTLKFNVKVTLRHVEGKRNTLADLLSRLKYKQFWTEVRKTGKQISKAHTPIPDILKNMEDVWILTEQNIIDRKEQEQVSSNQ